MFSQNYTTVIKGAGEMASGVALCLFRAGLRRILMLERPQPLCVRRSVSFCEAVYTGNQQVEEVVARLITSFAPLSVQLESIWRAGEIAVAVDSEWESVKILVPDLIVDAILAKRNVGTTIADAPLVIGLGPGFTAGVDVHLVVETQRGHNLGRVYERGAAEPNTGIPGPIGGYTVERVLRAPCSGVISAVRSLGDTVKAGETICIVDGAAVPAGIDGILRGLIRSGVWVEKGLKIGDVDPRGVRDYCWTVSEKARALGGAVLTALCSSRIGRRDAMKAEVWDYWAECALRAEQL